jgi:hypothetical protein
MSLQLALNKARCKRAYDACLEALIIALINVLKTSRCPEFFR